MQRQEAAQREQSCGEEQRAEEGDLAGRRRARGLWTGARVRAPRAGTLQPGNWLLGTRRSVTCLPVRGPVCGGTPVEGRPERGVKEGKPSQHSRGAIVKTSPSPS